MSKTMLSSLQAEVLKERSSSRVKLNVVVRAPLLIIPYTVSALSPTSPLSSPTSTTERAFMANLGELVVKNEFKLASEVMPGKEEERDQSLFLSPLGHPAIMDYMTVTISSVQLQRSVASCTLFLHIHESVYMYVCTVFVHQNAPVADRYPFQGAGYRTRRWKVRVG